MVNEEIEFIATLWRAGGSIVITIPTFWRNINHLEEKSKVKVNLKTIEEIFIKQQLKIEEIDTNEIKEE